MTPPGRSRGGLSGCQLPAPIGWGSERRASTTDVCCRSTTRPVSLLDCRTEASEPGSRTLANGISGRKLQTPHAFHEFEESSCSGQLFIGPFTRGSRQAFAFGAPTFVLRAPFCEANDQGPRPGRWPSPSLGSASRSASRRPSTASPRCLEFASTTDVSRHEHPSETPPLETTRRPPWGNPAGLRLRDPLRPRRFRRSAEKDAGPPRGHPASSSRVLDGTPPASGRPALTCASARCAFAPVNQRLSELCRLPGSLAEASPLTPLIATGEGSRNRASSSRRARFNRRTSMRSDFLWLEVPSVAGRPLSERSCERLFNGALPSLASWSNGQERGQPLHVLTCARHVDHRLDLLPRAAFRGRFVGRVRFYDFCK